MQQASRFHLQVSSVSEVKTNEPKAAGQNGAQGKAPEYYEVCSCRHAGHMGHSQNSHAHICVSPFLQVTLAKPLGCAIFSRQ